MPSWIPYMMVSCLAAFLIGYILAWAMDQWRDR